MGVQLIEPSVIAYTAFRNLLIYNIFIFCEKSGYIFDIETYIVPMFECYDSIANTFPKDLVWICQPVIRVDTSGSLIFTRLIMKPERKAKQSKS